jgi:hypothetical protein
LRAFRDVCEIAIKSQLVKICNSGAYASPITGEERIERNERLPDILIGWLRTIAMPEPLESKLAGVTLESDALPQEDFPPGDVRRRPEAFGNLHIGQAAALPTYGLHQVDNETLC